jgi:TPR repeat protein
MKASLLLVAGALAMSQTFAQYSATQLTRKVAPRPQQAAPAGGAAGAGYAAPAAPVDPAKVAAQKQKTESDLIKYHRQRAEAGSESAQYELGVRYLTGNGVEKNEKLGREWLEKSAKQGSPKAVRKLEELGPAPAETVSAPAIPAAPSTTPAK